MPLKLIIFDLDGTLVDTSIDITRALNYAIKPYGLHELKVEETVGLVGEGITRLLEKVLGEERAGLRDDAVLRFLDYYSDHLTDYSRIYPGVRETLGLLGGYRKAVISNKREALSVRLLERLDLVRYFDLVVGGDSAAEKKPSPAPVLHVLREFSLPARDAVIVGDSNYDIEAGARAGVKTIAVTYGYRKRELLGRADYMMDRMDELPGVLSEIAAAAERRREKRHLVPDTYRDYIEFHIKIGGVRVRAGLLDFSGHGLRIESPLPLDPGYLMDCTIAIPKSLTKGTAFKARVRHSLEQGDGFVIGAEIESIEDEVWFRIVGRALDFIWEKDYFREGD